MNDNRQMGATFVAIFLVVLSLVISVVALIEASQAGDVQTMALTGTGQTDLTTLVLAEDLTVGDDATITDDAAVGGDLSVTGSTSVGSITFSGATVNGNLTVTGTSDLQGNISDSGGALTFADNTLVDGAADAVQLTVQGYTTQTNSLLVLEQSDGTDKLTVDNSGNTAVAGTLTVTGTSTLVGNASASANLTVDTDLTVDDTFNIDDTAYTLTGTQTLTPTASYYEMNPSGQLTVTLAAACTAGDLYLFANKANQTVTFVDTNIRTTDGNAVALNQYDTVAWQCVAGTEYYLIYNSANQ